TLCDAIAWTALSLTAVGRSREALALGREGQILAERLGHHGAQILLGRAIALSDFVDTCDLATVDLRVEHDLELCRQINSPWIVQGYVWAAANLATEGRYDEAIPLLDRAIAEEPPSAYAWIGLGFKLKNRALAGDTDAVNRLLEDAMPQMPSQGLAGWGPTSLLVGASDAAAIVGRRDIVEELYDRLAEVPQHVAFAWFDGEIVHRTVAMAAST